MVIVFYMLQILIAGPTDVGKSTLAKILVNYAARSENSPILVDLDVGQSCISIPGTLGIILLFIIIIIYYFMQPLLCH